MYREVLTVPNWGIAETVYGDFFFEYDLRNLPFFTGLKQIPRKRVVAFLLSGSVLIGVANVLRELCGCQRAMSYY